MLGSMATAVPVPAFMKRATHHDASSEKDVAVKACTTEVHNTVLTSTPFYITFNGTISGEPCEAATSGNAAQYFLHSTGENDLLEAVNINGTSSKGTTCNITIPDNGYQQISGKDLFVFVPLVTDTGNQTTIVCGDDSKAVPLNVNLASYDIPGLTNATSTTASASPTQTHQAHQHAQHTTTTTEEPRPTHHHTTTTTTTTHHHTTTTTTHHAQHTEDSSDSGSGSQSFSGIGTWFIPATEGGSQGACGPFESNSELIGALNAPQYGDMSEKSSWCGKKVKVTSGGKSVIITINDACPECAHGSIDLTQAAFEKLGNLVTGVLDITWSVV
ncbi:unnamed protein product [Umbelopsis sp. WA50703]